MAVKKTKKEMGVDIITALDGMLPARPSLEGERAINCRIDKLSLSHGVISEVKDGWGKHTPLSLSSPHLG